MGFSSVLRRRPVLIASVAGLALGALLGSFANSRTLSAASLSGALNNLFLLVLGMWSGWRLTCGILLSRKLVAPAAWVGYSPLGCFCGSIGAALMFWSGVSASGSHFNPLDPVGIWVVVVGSLLHAHARRQLSGPPQPGGAAQ
jgi:hypothetical protein